MLDKSAGFNNKIAIFSNGFVIFLASIGILLLPVLGWLKNSKRKKRDTEIGLGP